MYFLLNMVNFHCYVSLPEGTPYMDVSENSGIPKSSILIGISIINHYKTPI